MSIFFLLIYFTFLLFFFALITLTEWILNKRKDSQEGNCKNNTYESMGNETFVFEKNKKMYKNKNCFPQKNNRKKIIISENLKNQINKIDLNMHEPKEDKQKIAILKKNNRRDDVPAKNDSNLDAGKKGPEKNGEKNQNIKFEKNSKKKNEEIKDLKEKLDKFEQVLNLIFQNNNLIFNIYNIRISNLEKDNEFLRSAYKVLFYRKISNSLLEKIFMQKENFRKTPVLFEDNTKPIEKRTKFPIIIAIKPNDKKKRNEINLLIDYLMFIRDYSSSIIHISDKTAFYQIEYLLSYLNLNQEDINDNFNSYENFTLSTSEILSLLFDNNIEDSNNNINENVYNFKDNGNDINFYLNINENFDFSEEIISKKIKQNEKILEKLRIKDFSMFKSKLSINSDLIFSQWKKSFSLFSYKQQEEYKNLVKFSQDITTQKMSDILKEIVGDNTFEFYKQDAKNFSGMVNSLEKEDLYKFYNN